MGLMRFDSIIEGARDGAMQIKNKLGAMTTLTSTGICLQVQ